MGHTLLLITASALLGYGMWLGFKQGDLEAAGKHDLAQILRYVRLGYFFVFMFMVAVIIFRK